MPIFKLCEWENNSYHDSDFFVGLYDSDTQTCYPKQIGSTRYAGGIQYPEGMKPCTPHVAELARQWLERRWFQVMRAEEHHRCAQPARVDAGERVVFLEAHINRKASKLCPKCNGSGDWVNPHRPADRRVCFYCNGRGILRQNVGHSIKIAPGNAGSVIRCHVNYDFHSYSGRPPFRHDYTCIVLLDDGSIVVAPLKKLRLERDPQSDQAIGTRAHARSFRFEWGHFFGAVAWLSTNEAASVHGKDTPCEKTSD